MKKLIKQTLVAGAVWVLSSLPSWGVESSSLFTWENDSTYVHCKLNGTLSEEINWEARDVNLSKEDIEFHQNLFNNEITMRYFGDGSVRSPELTKNRVKGWVERFEKGEPNGGMIIFQKGTNNPIGHVVAGTGDRPGCSEVAGALIPKEGIWNKGIASDVMKQITTVWAPMVRQIGLEENHLTFRQCFGGKALERMDATSSPVDVASWKVLDKNNFHPAKANVDQSFVIEIDPDLCRVEGKIDFALMEQYIMKTYYTLGAENKLQEGVRYAMTDPEGRARTISKSTRFNKLKYHFEYDVK